MPIRKGGKAIGFTLPAKPGETVDLAQHLGRDKIVLLFFPLAFSLSTFALTAIDE